MVQVAVQIPLKVVNLRGWLWQWRNLALSRHLRLDWISTFQRRLPCLRCHFYLSRTIFKSLEWFNRSRECTLFFGKTHFNVLCQIRLVHTLRRLSFSRVKCNKLLTKTFASLLNQFCSIHATQGFSAGLQTKLLSQAPLLRVSPSWFVLCLLANHGKMTLVIIRPFIETQGLLDKRRGLCLKFVLRFSCIVALRTAKYSLPSSFVVEIHRSSKTVSLWQVVTFRVGMCSFVNVEKVSSFVNDNIHIKLPRSFCRRAKL